MPGKGSAQNEDEKRRDWVGLSSDEEDVAHSSADEEEDAGRSRFTTKRRKLDIRKDESEGEDTDGEGESESEVEVPVKKPATAPKSKSSSTKATSSDNENDEEEVDDTDLAPNTSVIITSSSTLKPLTQKQLLKSKALLSKTGVVYLSRIPPFMKPMKVKDLLSKFGSIGRIFLSPEDPKAHARRVKYGGNKKKNFEEGWVEFLNKKDAKLCAETLNAQIIGGKKGNWYHDDVWNIKYLPKFKWHHLQAQIGEWLMRVCYVIWC